MKISKQRRVYAGVLGLAVAAWVGDRFILSGGPEPAGAGMIAAADLVVPSAGQPTGGASAVAAPAGIGLAERLDELRLRQQYPRMADDAFLVPVAWRPEVAKAKAAESAAPVFDVAAFIKAHRLTAVMYNKADPSRSAAVVDGGTIVRTGESLDATLGGMILREVTAEKAVFEHDGVVVELRIERGGGTGGTDGKVAAPSENGGDAGHGR